MVSCQEEMERDPLGAAVQEQEEVQAKASGVLEEWAATALAQGPEATASVLAVGQKCPIKEEFHATTLAVLSAVRRW